MGQTETSTNTELEEKLSVTILEASNNEQNASFLNSILLLHILLHLPHNDISKKDLFNKLKALANQNNEYSKQIAESFSRDYNAEKAISWYTEMSFIFKKLNEALRKFDIDFLYGIRHLLFDLHQQLQKHHLKFDTKKTLYRGVTLTANMVQELDKKQGQLVYFGQFLSTSIDEEVAKGFIKKVTRDKEAVLFHIDISSYAHVVCDQDEPITYIKEFSQRPSEKEVLLSPASVFRIMKVEKLLEMLPNTNKEVDLYHVYLKLTIERDSNLQAVLQSLKTDLRVIDELQFMSAEEHKFGRPEEYSFEDDNSRYRVDMPTDLIHLAKFVRRLDKLDVAVKYYKMALEDENIKQDEQLKTIIFTDLAVIHRQKKEFDEAIASLDKAYASAKKCKLSENDRPFRAIMNNRGMVFKYRKEFQHAFGCFHNSLNMLDKAKDGNDQELATILNNLGTLLAETRDFKRATSYFQQVLSLQEKVLPPNHPDIARTYNNMSTCCRSDGEFNLSLEYAEKAEMICSKVQPQDHLSMGAAKKNLGMAQYELKHFDEAYKNLETAGEILKGKQYSFLGPELEDIESYKNLSLQQLLASIGDGT